MQYARGAGTGGGLTMAELISRYGGPMSRHGEDQDFLGQSVWPLFTHNFTSHDSEGVRWCAGMESHCHNFPTSDAARDVPPTCVQKSDPSLCLYFCGAPFQVAVHPNIPCCLTFDCRTPPTCTKAWRSYLDEFREMTGHDLPSKFIDQNLPNVP